MLCRARCSVAMEACPGSHSWGREIRKLGHRVPPAYGKPFGKRQKNDMADAEAIWEAAQRPTPRFVAVKSEDKQASVLFRTRDRLVRQRTPVIDAIHGHLAESGLIAPQGPSHVDRRVAPIASPDSAIPEAARSCLNRWVEMIRALHGRDYGA
jgi:Transposase and inactivated derivatives